MHLYLLQLLFYSDPERCYSRKKNSILLERTRIKESWEIDLRLFFVWTRELSWLTVNKRHKHSIQQEILNKNVPRIRHVHWYWVLFILFLAGDVVYSATRKRFTYTPIFKRNILINLKLMSAWSFLGILHVNTWTTLYC